MVHHCEQATETLAASSASKLTSRHGLVAIATDSWLQLLAADTTRWPSVRSEPWSRPRLSASVATMTASSPPNVAELAVLSNQLQIAPLDPADLADVLAFSRPRELARGGYLLRGGERATHVGVVLHGLLREFFVMNDGTERTKAFIRESQITGSLADLLSNQPSRAFIRAEEPVRMLILDFEHVRRLSERSPAWARWNMRMLERLFMIKAEREYELLGMDAEERYHAFTTRFEGLEARVAARHIATYVGITPVHLSRLRRRRANRSRV